MSATGNEYLLGVTATDAAEARARLREHPLAVELLDKLWAAGGLLPDQFGTTPTLEQLDADWSADLRLSAGLGPDEPVVWDTEEDLLQARRESYGAILDTLRNVGLLTVHERTDALAALPPACWGRGWDR